MRALANYPAASRTGFIQPNCVTRDNMARVDVVAVAARTHGRRRWRDHRPRAARVSDPRRAPFKACSAGITLSGLIFAPFMLAWIFSGFLSMDDGTLFAHSDALFRALHRLDFEPLSSHPWLRTSAIAGLCLCGLAFSLTGVVLASRRLSSSTIGDSRWTDRK